MVVVRSSSTGFSIITSVNIDCKPFSCKIDEVSVSYIRCKISRTPTTFVVDTYCTGVLTGGTVNEFTAVHSHTKCCNKLTVPVFILKRVNTVSVVTVYETYICYRVKFTICNSFIDFIGSLHITLTTGYKVKLSIRATLFKYTV